MKDVFHRSGLFTGWPSNVVPIHNIEAIAGNKFYLVGKMMSACLIHGGQAPLCLSKAVADYLIFGKIKCPPCLSDIPNQEIRQKLLEVYM